MSEITQQTIAREAVLRGRGLHTGDEVTVRVLPAPPNAGIVFIRADLAPRPTIPVKTGRIVSVEKSVRRTTLVKDGIEVQTVEHCMAALWGAGIDNAFVELSSPELPGLDGSSLEYLRAFKQAGTAPQAAPRHRITLREPVYVHDGEASITVVPDSTLRISYLLSYPHPQLHAQFASYPMNGASFEDAIAPARTFCLKEEADALKAAGFGRGADYHNTLVMDAHGVVDNTLRFDNEFARHKVLDLLGDLFLLGGHLCGHVIALRSGHPLNVKLLAKITQAREQWRVGALQSGAPEVMVGPALDITQIQKILPHRYPFLLVDRITELTEHRAVGIKNVTINDYFFRGHFPDHPVMPGVLIVEAMAQVAGIVLLNKQEHLGKIAYFMSVDKVKFRRPVVPGDQLVLQAELTRLRSRVGEAAGQAFVDGKLVCEAELRFALGE